MRNWMLQYNIIDSSQTGMWIRSESDVQLDPAMQHYCQ
jgi:hypothetical protein